ncbi:hypothetical protein NQ317_014213 [Molorchus minor]|uniref:Tyrosine-protein kinase n=1 Tax=Molorchus minor TaxID=1323400 RepID=A0ABQ9JEX8_9CUCU|nr:hypothetical protein NQ317_014213 [Molorchus minor]
MQSNNSTNRYDDICWYHGKITREEAENVLMQDGRKNGLFLVRDSSSSTGDYVLSVFYNEQVSHFQIRRHIHDAFFSIDECSKFHGLEILIEHYSNSPNALCEGLILTEYLKGNPPPHDSRRHGNTNLLHRATSQDNYIIVSELLKTGYRHEAKNQDGQTAVHLASIFGHNDILRKLIKHEASVNLRDTAGFTPLHNNFPATVRLLVQVGGADIQARHTESGAVPLHEAASRGHKEIVKELLSLNAPVRPRNKDNHVPSQLARMNNHIECAEILEEYKCPDGFLFIDDGPYLDSLEHIIEHYSLMPDGLPTILQFAVPPKPKPPVPQVKVNLLLYMRAVIERKMEEFAKVAIKTLHSEQIETNRDAFLSEAQVMMKLKHHCIVKLIGLSLGQSLLMVQELVLLGSILQYIDINKDRINPNYEFKIWAAQIACGMQYLEKNRFVHRDLASFIKGRQLLQGKERREMAVKMVCSESYNYGRFSHKSDVWSFGVTIWEMYSFGETPYGEKKGSDAIKLIDSGERLKQPKECPDHIYKIMLSCWESDADKRPTFNELVHVFASDSEYTNIRELLPETNLA